MSSTDAADLVFLGARVETMVDGAPPADAVAVRDGRIAQVGSSADARRLVAARTRVIELQGETLLPGFQDAHVHPISGGLLSRECDLHGLADAPAYLDAIAAHAAAHPDRDWITGGGWSLTAFPGGEPDRGLLDAIVPDRPVFLYSDDGHVGWANSRALALARIDRKTPDPADGRIARDAGGGPTGTLHDGAITALVDPLLPAPTHDDLLDGLRAGQRHLHALGITAWQDAHVEADALAAYGEAADAGWLTARVVAALWWRREAGLEQIETLERQRDASAIGRLRAGTVKLMLDGILESRTAFMTAPYIGSDGVTGTDAGRPFIEPQLLREAVIELDRRGFQAHVHAIGDGAVRLALDAVEAARAANGMTDHRHHIAHLEVVNPDDVPRFGRLGVVANMQPLWASDDDQMRTLRIPLLGPDRATWQYPFASLLRAGATLAGGSDWTVSSANPLLEIEVAVTRVDPDTRDVGPFLPDERLTLDAALRAFTIGSAGVNHLDADTGTIEVGKLADLAVLDRDLRDRGAGPIGEARVRLTFVEGVEVFSAEA
ncbi:MAG TPA: amidohydrolase [Candidatus Limnocylindria bacterium]